MLNSYTSNEFLQAFFSPYVCALSSCSSSSSKIFCFPLLLGVIVGGFSSFSSFGSLHFHLLHSFPLILLLQFLLSLAVVLLLILHLLPLILHCHQLINLLEYFILLSRNYIIAAETQGSLLYFSLYKVQTRVYKLLDALRRPKAFGLLLCVLLLIRSSCYSTLAYLSQI